MIQYLGSYCVVESAENACVFVQRLHKVSRTWEYILIQVYVTHIHIVLINPRQPECFETFSKCFQSLKTLHTDTTIQIILGT